MRLLASERAQISNASVQFQIELRNISRRLSRYPKYIELGRFALCVVCRGLGR